MLLPILAAIAVVLSGPFMGQLRGALQSALPEGTYRTVVGATVLLIVGGTACAVVVRIRDRRLLRYGSLALALAIGIAYARWTASGNANVDLVERVHFVEYGLLAVLFFRVWRARGDVSTFIAPAMACMIVAFADEWLQWFVPGRVGEIRDVGLDVVAIGCGLLFAVALAPPVRVVPRLTQRPAFGLAALSAATILAGASFIAAIHLGYANQLGSSTWRSRFSISELNRLSRERNERWSHGGAPRTLRRLSREDQYLAEGIWHVQRRNEAAGAGNTLAAWRENLILEQFYSPVLDWPSYAASSSSRWPQAQRDNVGADVSLDTRSYVSGAEPFPLFTWGRWRFWLTVAGIVAAVWVYCLGLGKWGRE